jgi:hypothetical protein
MHFSKNASFRGVSLFRKNRWSGADRVRTDDIQLAKLALSQLSYSPGKPACLWTLARVTNFLSSERHGGPRWT